MKRLILMVIVITLILLAACGPSTSTSKKITLRDAPDILDLSLLLPARFEHVDAASEGMSNADMGLGPDVSEVQLFFSEDPFQMIYCFLGIDESRVERASFDRTLQDETQMESLIVEGIRAGATEEGFEVTVPSVEITHPDIGDSAMLGEGYIQSYDLQLGFDTLWFRSNTVYVFIYSLYMSADGVALTPIAEEIETRISRFSQ